MIAGPVLPVRPTEALGSAKDVVTGAGGRAVLLPEATIPADRDDGRAATMQNSCMAPSPVRVPICSSGGIWFNKSGSTGLAPSRLEVNSTARMSPVAVSIARWTAADTGVCGGCHACAPAILHRRET